VLAIGVGGCADLPEVSYFTERLEIATDFDQPVCEGTLADLDAQVERIEKELGRSPDPRPIRVYWLEDGTEGFCADGRSGCYYPATRVLFSKAESLEHELLHAVVDSEGESYFVEEGLAELLSGVGVVYDNGDASPLSRLRLSRSDYRDGGLDYRAAAHFMHYVFRRGGTKVIRQLGLEIESDPSPARLEQVLADALDVPIERIERDYLDEAPRYYSGTAQSRLPELTTTQMLEGGVDITLAPGDPETRGPWPSRDAAMYRVFRIAVPAVLTVRTDVVADGDARVDVFDPSAKVGRGRLTDWHRPDPKIDPDAVSTLAGRTSYSTMLARTYLVVVSSDESGPVRVHVTWERTSLDLDPG
jgi:hypothetical protein